MLASLTLCSVGWNTGNLYVNKAILVTLVQETILSIVKTIKAILYFIYGS